MKEHGRVLLVGAHPLTLFTFASLDYDIRILSLESGPTSMTALDPLLENLRVMSFVDGVVSALPRVIHRQ